MSFFSKIIEKRKMKKEELNKECDALIALFSDAIENARLAFDQPEKNGTINNESEVPNGFPKESYIEPSFEKEWKTRNANAVAQASEKNLAKYKKSSFYNELKKKSARILEINQKLGAEIAHYNENVAKKMVDYAYSLIGNVEGRALDMQQMTCVVKESHNHLVVAGAGSGKTTTVVGKVKYLLKSGKYKPEDILVLSFTNASAAEMSERIHKETGEQIEASTFHKLGLNIIAKSEGVMPKISKIALRDFIREKMKDLMASPAYVRSLTQYLVFHKVHYKSEFDFTSANEYEDYLRLNPPSTINGDQVKSYGEMDIANFLFSNNVKYEYEAAYKFDTRTETHAQYYPDFYLPDYDIYIEYFGVNRAGEVPSYFKGGEGKTASEKYNESMNWKRDLHKEHDTKMIECFSYEKMEGSLLDSLENKLKVNGVTMSQVSPKEMWDKLSSEDDKLLGGLIELFETVINLMKSNDLTIEQFTEKVRDARESLRFVDLISPLVKAYDEKLKASGEIDFNDMINLATNYIRSGKYSNPYSYVIVDEYQDISKARFTLLNELRKSRDYDLFCVGDDWQSIYRFAGSDIGYILNFEKYWGKTTISRIETTYRFTNSLISISGDFITENPSQIKKKLKGKLSDSRFSMGEVVGYNESYAVSFMAERIIDLPKDSTVFFIGRYSFDSQLLDDSGVFNCKYNNETGFVDVKYDKRPDLKMCFMTAHKSKGLQADYVFIINNKNTKTGFPSKIQDDPILGLLLESTESFPYAEERRLFYVAMTRAKKKVFLLVDKNKKSEFALEMEGKYASELKKEQFECPLCGGRLLKKEGKFGEFWGCENYPKIGCKYTRKTNSGTKASP